MLRVGTQRLMATEGSFLYLSSADIDALGLTAQSVESAVAAAYRALGQGKAASVPKSGFNVTPSTFFHAMPARYDEQAVVGIKWIGTADNSARGLPHINSIMVDKLDEALDHGEVVVIGNNAAEFADVPMRLGKDQILIDLVRVGGTTHLGDRYDGINW